MVEAIVADGPIPRASIDAINALIGQSSGVTKVVKTPRKFERRFEFELNQPKQLLVPLAESAADLLCRGDFSRLKRCANPNCAAFSGPLAAAASSHGLAATDERKSTGDLSRPAAGAADAVEVSKDNA